MGPVAQRIAGAWILLAIGAGCARPVEVEGPTAITPPKAVAAKTGGKRVVFALQPGSRELSPWWFGVHHTAINRLRPPGSPAYPPALADLFRELEPSLVRGPAGTHANYWSWSEGRYLASDSPRYRDRYGSPPRIVERAEARDYARQSLPDLLAPALDLGVPYCFVANVVASDEDDIRSLAVELRRLSAGRPVLIELGNELYADRFARAFPTPEAYVERARRYYRVIKSAVPDARVAVPTVDPVLLLRAGRRGARDPGDWARTGAARVGRWARAIAGARDVGDAVVVHHYNRPRELERARTQRDVMDRFFTESALFAGEISRLSAKLGDRPLWVTEWGNAIPEIARAREASEKARFQLLKSVGDAVVAADLLGRMLDLAEVELTAYHNLAATDGAGLAQPLSGGRDFVQLPKFHTISAWGRTVRRFPVYYPVALTTHRNTRRLSPPDLRATLNDAEVGLWVLGDDAGPTRAVWINRTAAPRRVRLAGRLLRKLWEYGDATRPLGNWPAASLETWTSVPDDVPRPRQYPDDAPPEADTEIPGYTMTITELLPQRWDS